MAKKEVETPKLPDDLKTAALEVDPEEPKGVLKVVLDAFERGVKLGREFAPVTGKNSFWD